MKAIDSSSPIAIVGIAALFPGSVDKHGFWRDILAGRDLMTDVPPSHWLIDDYYDPDPKARDKTYAKRGAFLSDVDFDPMAWGLPPSNLPSTDTAQLLGLVVAQQVLADACQGQFDNIPRDRTSVILGVTSAQELLGSMVSRLQRPVWAKSLRDEGFDEASVTRACDRIASHYVEWKESSFPGVLGNVVAGRIAHRLDLHGTNCVTDAACASSLSALAMGVSELRLGESDLVISGGVDTMNDIFMYVCFSKTPALSPTGDCRPFSDRADGTLLGEGIGMFALRRLADAERDNDRIYAVIRGIGSSSDGRGSSVYAPRPAGQALALRRAYARAGHGPDTVELVEAHGTGTPAGDQAEFQALRQVFEESGRKGAGWCALGSVKSQIGHTKAAAGAAGLFKAALALTHAVLPPTIKVERPDPRLGMDASPFFLNTTARPWVRGKDHPRRAAVSSFGFGGTNFHVTLEEYTGPAPRALRIHAASSELIVVGSSDPDVLATRCREFAERLRGGDYAPALARASQEAFDASSHWRTFVVGASPEHLATQLEKVAELGACRESADVPGAFAVASGERQGDLAFVFPGQGSHYLDMGRELLLAFRSVLRVWDDARSLDFGPGGLTLDEVVYPKPVFDAAAHAAQRARLKSTEWAQPAIGAVSLSLLTLLGELGVTPDAVAGHSLGEVSALCAAGVLEPLDLLRIARRRGELMAAAAASTPGAMTAVVAGVDELQPYLARAAGDVVIANYNAPRQLVLSGPVESLAQLEGALSADGIASTRLAVSSAFHGPLVRAAAGPLRAYLEGIPFHCPRMPVLGHRGAEPYPTEPGAMRDLLARQLAEPVRFVDQIEALYAAGVRTFVEVGPRNVLTNLIGAILGRREHRAIALSREGRSDRATLNEGLGRLSVAGVPLSYARLWSDVAPEPAARARPAAARASTSTVQVRGSSYGKPYPPARSSAAPAPNAVAQSAHTPAPDASARVSRGAVMNDPRHRGAAPGAAPPAPATPARTRIQTTAPDAAPEPRLDARVQLAWLEAFREMQRQTVECHQSFQRVTAEAHAAFLRSAEASLTSLTALVAGRSDPGPDAWAPIAFDPLPPATALAATERRAGTLEVPSPVAMPNPPPAATPSHTPPRPAQPAPMAPSSTGPNGHAREANRDPSPVAAPTAFSRELLEELGLDVLADCTGYPREMLGADMDLEGDLGVDSIKRVEIISTLRKRQPGLPEVPAAELAPRRTIRQLASLYLEALHGAEREPARAQPTGARARARADAPAASDEDPAPVDDLALGRWLSVARPAPALDLGTPGLFEAHGVAVTDDGTGIGAALVALLTRHGARASLVDRVPPDVGAVIFLGGLREVADSAGALEVNREAFRAFRAVAARFAERGGCFVSVQDTGGDFGLSGSDRAWLGGAAALGRTAAREWPSACVRALDVARDGRSSSDIATAIWDELCAGGEQPDVGLSPGQRRVLESQPAPLAGSTPSDLSIAADSLIVVSGGARGVTSACVVALAERFRCRFVLLGRTAHATEPASASGIIDPRELRRALWSDARARAEPLTPAELEARAQGVSAGREIRATLAAIEAAGGQARYAAVDVSDAEEVRRLLVDVRQRWGRISGVIHGAGVLADRRLMELTESQFESVFRTKALGLQALLEATREDAPSFVLAFSSVVARAGNPGQAAYALANEIVNKVIALEQRRHPKRLLRALAFGPWQGGMVNAGLRAHFTRQGVPLIPLAAGAAQLCRELSHGREASSEVIIGFGDSLGATPRREQRRDVIVDRDRYPCLDAHRIGGVPVVPIALVLEWFARCARAWWPGCRQLTFENVHVRRGIRLLGYDAGQSLRLQCRARIDDASPAHALLLELLGEGGALHYSASIATGAGPVPPLGAPSAGPLAPVTTRAPIYGANALFHGPAFQVIERIDRLDDAGVSATLVSAAARGGPGLWPGPWLLDPLLLDGGLQLALSWARHVSRAPSLPTRIGSVHLELDLDRGPDLDRAPTGPIRCVLTGRENDADRTVSDIVFTDAAGRTLATYADVVTHRLPDTLNRASAAPP